MKKANKKENKYVEGKQKRKEYMKKYGEKYRKNVGNISTKTCLTKTNQERTNIGQIGTKMCQTKKQDQQRRKNTYKIQKKIYYKMSLKNASKKISNTRKSTENMLEISVPKHV